MLITTRVEGRFEPEGWEEPFAGKRPPERQRMLDESFGKIKPLTPEMLRRKYGPKRMQVTAKTTGRAESRDYDPVKTFVQGRANRPEKSRLDYYKEAKMEPAGKLPMTTRRARKLEKHPPNEDLVGAAMKLVGGKRAVHEHPNVYAAVRTGLEMIPGVSHMTREGALSEDPRKVAKRVGRDAGLGVLYSMAGGMTGEMAGKFGPTIAKAGKKVVGKQLSGALAKFERYKKSLPTSKGKAKVEKIARERKYGDFRRPTGGSGAIDKASRARVNQLRRTKDIKKVEDRVAGYWREKTTTGKPGGKLPARNPKRTRTFGFHERSGLTRSTTQGSSVNTRQTRENTTISSNI